MNRAFDLTTTNFYEWIHQLAELAEATQVRSNIILEQEQMGLFHGDAIGDYWFYQQLYLDFYALFAKRWFPETTSEHLEQQAMKLYQGCQDQDNPKLLKDNLIKKLYTYDQVGFWSLPQKLPREENVVAYLTESTASKASSKRKARGFELFRPTPDGLEALDPEELESPVDKEDSADPKRPRENFS